MTRQTLVYPFPLDEGYMVQLVLPRNLSELEAARLCEFIAGDKPPQVGLD